MQQHMQNMELLILISQLLPKSKIGKEFDTI